MFENDVAPEQPALPALPFRLVTRATMLVRGTRDDAAIRLDIEYEDEDAALAQDLVKTLKERILAINEAQSLAVSGSVQ